MKVCIACIYMQLKVLGVSVYCLQCSKYSSHYIGVVIVVTQHRLYSNDLQRGGHEGSYYFHRVLSYVGSPIPGIPAGGGSLS